MAKDDKKDNKKANKGTGETTAGDSWLAQGAPPAGTYSDGHPLDSVQYLEAKLILKPDRFVSVESFRDFGKQVQRTAKNLAVGFVTDPKVGRRPDIREIVFMDTPDFRLYNNAFILRRRITYIDGFPIGDPEIVFKFRHSDEKKAAELDVRPNIAGKYQIKFKAEALPLKDQYGGFRLLYSHNCQFGLSQMHEGDRLGMWGLAHVFPALSVLKKSEDEEVTLVNEAIVEEVLLELGDLDFGKGVQGHCNVALVAHPRRAHAPGGRVRLSAQVRSPGRCPRKAQEAVGAVLHHPAARRAGLDFPGHDEDGNGLSSARQPASEP